jgi:hypothetical protein
MRRTLLRFAAWAGATVGAMAVSWLGVHSVLTTDATGQVSEAIPITAPASTTSAPAAPSPTPAPPAGTAPASVRSPSSSPQPTTTTTSSAAGNVHSYQLTGGRVAVELGTTSATLVSATPEAGWQVKAWQTDGWLRVDFSRDDKTSSCLVTWNGHPPTVQTT